MAIILLQVWSCLFHDSICCLLLFICYLFVVYLLFIVPWFNPISYISFFAGVPTGFQLRTSVPGRSFWDKCLRHGLCFFQAACVSYIWTYSNTRSINSLFKPFRLGHNFGTSFQKKSQRVQHPVFPGFRTVEGNFHLYWYVMCHFGVSSLRQKNHFRALFWVRSYIMGYFFKFYNFFKVISL